MARAPNKCINLTPRSAAGIDSDRSGRRLCTRRWTHERGDVMGHALQAALLVLVLSLALAACGHDAPQPSGVYGIVTVAAKSPASTGMGETVTTTALPASPLPGGFGQSSDTPCPQAVVAVKALSGAHSGEVVARATCDDQGLFRVTLAPGTYALSTTTGAVAHPPAIVSVKTGFARVIVPGGQRD
jgi:hypothetical protein